MMRSLFSGVSGLKNHQTRMDVIGNNIANVNTVGFKGSRVQFQDVLNQTIQGAAAGTGTRGGTNPMQVGLGMGMASIDTMFTDGSAQPTGKQTDLAISGQGFFVLSDGNSQVYTRAGNFDFDTGGNYLVPGSGYKVMGWQADSTGKINTSGAIANITVPVGSTMAANATTTITYANNLSAAGAIKDAAATPPVAGATASASITAYDSMGNAHKVNGTFTRTTPTEWEFTPAAQTDTNYAVTGGPYTITFNSDGTYKSVTSDPTDPLNPMDPIVGDLTKSGASNISIIPDFSSLTQYGNETTVQATNQNGYAAGTLDNTSIDPTGTIVGRFTNGQSKYLAKVALATFNNPSGLNKSGTSLYTKSSNSGEPQVGPSGSGGRGSFTPGALEMSNVDLAQEFSNMIITQRGFQANSKIITTTDQMLEELSNLKR